MVLAFHGERPLVLAVSLHLYDLNADPHEQKNLAADPAQAERLAQMRADIERWMNEQDDAQRVFGEPRLLAPAAR